MSDIGCEILYSVSVDGLMHLKYGLIFTLVTRYVSRWLGTLSPCKRFKSHCFSFCNGGREKGEKYFSQSI